MNKNKSHVEYLRRINLALVFIEQHLDDTIRLEDVARASHFSPYHFHRIFHGIMHETVNDYISRKRMERASKMLMYRQAMSISDVALAGGFSSGANFARAFKQYFGVSPSELRNFRPENSAAKQNSKIGKLYSKYGKEFKVQDIYSQLVTQSGVFDQDKLEEMLMKIKIKDVDEKAIAYLSSPKGYQLDSVYDTWNRLVQWAKGIELDSAYQYRFAICHDNPHITPEDKCRYDAAIVIEPGNDVPSPFERSVIPAGKYAIIHYKDVADKISHFMTELCSTWMPDSGYEPDDYPPMFNYQNDAREDGFVEMEIYIKLKDLKVA